MNRLILIFMTMVFLLSGCAKYRLDAQVRERCAKDGGIRVYETVKLPPDKFNKWGQIDFYHPTEEEYTLGIEYLFKSERYYYIKGDYEQPSMWRIHFHVYRRADGKLLGESIGYGRRGGDFLSPPFHSSTYTCPEDYGRNQLFQEIFIKMNSEE